MRKKRWSGWRRFPNALKRGILVAPIGPGCYQLRRCDTHDLVLFGQARNVARRMSSLLPHNAGGGGHRSNSRKRTYVEKNIGKIEYHTCACDNVEQARFLESRLRRDRHMFHT